jgi:hypothetical protein
MFSGSRLRNANLPNSWRIRGVGHKSALDGYTLESQASIRKKSMDSNMTVSKTPKTLNILDVIAFE